VPSYAKPDNSGSRSGNSIIADRYRLLELETVPIRNDGQRRFG
jgi:hypothetical protein